MFTVLVARCAASVPSGWLRTPSSVPTRVGCARVWWAHALGEGGASGGAVIGWRLQFDANAASWGGSCQPAGSPTAARATRWASRSSGTVGLPHARIDHPPVTLPSPVLVVTLTVCGSSAPENVAAVRVPPYPLRLPGRFFVTSVGRSRLSGPNLNDVHTAKTDRRLTNSSARVVMALLSQRHAFVFAGTSWTRLGSSYRPGSGWNADGTAVIRA